MLDRVQNRLQLTLSLLVLLHGVLYGFQLCLQIRFFFAQLFELFIIDPAVRAVADE